jgi:hypothetical protein
VSESFKMPEDVPIIEQEVIEVVKKEGLEDKVGNPVFEKSTEQILRKDEVMNVIRRYAENPKQVRELADDQGLYLLEVSVSGEKEGETIHYEYMRKGRFPNNNEASETAIHKVYYDGDMPVGGDKVAVYKPETDEWEDIR